MSGPVAIYRAVMLEFERRRMALGLPMDKFSEYAGLPDRYYAKALHADQPSGRQAQWGTVQVIADALFPGGFDVEIKARCGEMNMESLKAKLLQLRATTDPKSQRQLMSDLGKKGGKRSGESRRAKAVRRKAVSDQRRHAAACRWSTPVITEITEQVRGKRP